MKKFLPLLGTCVLSPIVFVAVFAVVLFAGVNKPGDPIDKNLAPAIILGFGMVVLVWIGAGMEFVVARIRFAGMRVVAILGAFVVAPAMLCVCLPTLVAIAGINFLTSPPDWKMLPALPEKPVEIIGADHITVYVSTTSGNSVRCVVTQPTTCWQPTTKPATRVLVSNVHERETTHAPATNPPGRAVGMLGVEYVQSAENKKEIHYALLADGSVWYVDRDVSNTSAIFVGAIVLPVLIALSAVGLTVIYLGAGVSALARRWAGKY